MARVLELHSLDALKGGFDNKILRDVIALVDNKRWHSNEMQPVKNSQFMVRPWTMLMVRKLMSIR